MLQETCSIYKTAGTDRINSFKVILSMFWGRNYFLLWNRWFVCEGEAAGAPEQRCDNSLFCDADSCDWRL